MTHLRGKACVAFMFEEGENTIFSDWSEHGLCELWKRKFEYHCPKCGNVVPDINRKFHCTNCNIDLRQIGKTLIERW
jgi:DNA-directed RNA polymerase subunit RPC12/RpoP